ncbi:MAG: NAD(P)H-quinone oxidoreductase subunit [Moorella sp. (in: firmicutes)]|uniref:NADH-quinone oxidoreductase subunit K n=1 Tax=Neomoorella thermoacetica TaxID=1525 RepID=A0A1J5NMK2_NEOTH|nr:NAD(P)H-quinone oxidoreductase subunit [Moorella sp. (in: firmicutes)]OIQ59846.1 NADH-quinone oxidoreductase subunit K [Moorella thermoacetica]
MITLNHYLAVGGLLFCIGLFGALAKRNAIAVLMGIELMLNAVNINLVAFNHFLAPDQVTGQIFAIFVIVVAAAEVAVGLALVLNIYRRRLDSNIDDLDWLKW